MLIEVKITLGLMSHSKNKIEQCLQDGNILTREKETKNSLSTC